MLIAPGRCDRYWGFLQNCRMPTAPQDMPLPFRCSQDALFEIKFWNDKGVRFREADFLDHPDVPPEIKATAVRVLVHEHAPAAEAASAESRYTATLRPGTPMSDVARAVDAANPDARLIEIGTADIRRLCKWLGSTVANRRFNALARYVLHEQSRYCPGEDHDEKVANIPNWNWRNPFTAYNCTWGFATPTDFPEPADGLAPCAKGSAGVALVERSNSTTCPRVMLCGTPISPISPHLHQISPHLRRSQVMLCGVAVHPDGNPTGPLEQVSATFDPLPSPCVSSSRV